jgi:hypothetical protein
MVLLVHNTHHGPWNRYSSSAPIIVDQSGNSYGYFCANHYHPDRTRIAVFIQLFDAYEQVDDLTKIRDSTAEANFAGCVLGKLPRIGFPFERCADADRRAESRGSRSPRGSQGKAPPKPSQRCSRCSADQQRHRLRVTRVGPSLAKGESRGAVVSHEPQEPPREGLAPKVASSALNAPRTSSRKPRMRARSARRSAIASRVKSPWR